jgi:hypothetical protein
MFCGAGELIALVLDRVAMTDRSLDRVGNLCRW